MTAAADLSVAELLTAFRARTLSPVDVLDEAYARLDRFEPQLNAVTHQDREGARAAAKASEARWRAGDPSGPLDGVPASVKANVLKAGWPARRGSRQSSEAPVASDAPAVAALERAGAIFLAQTTMPEFGWKGIGDSPLTGITHNPWKLGHTTGGSSAGAAALAALGIGHLHIGTDGLGSIRMPSSFSGVFGHKPSFGLVPAYPASPFGILSHLGPMTRRVEDAALMLSALVTPDWRDVFAWNNPAQDFAARLAAGVKGLRIAWSPDLGFVTGIDADVARLTAAAARRFEELGASVEQAHPGFTLEEARVPADIMWWSGAAAVLDTIADERHGEMDPGFVESGLRGRRLKATDLVGAFTGRAALYEKMRAFHERYDLLLTPTMPITALPVGQDVPPDGSWGEDWVNWSPFTYPFNVTAQPAATVPCGLASNSLPVGLQIIGPPHRDDLVLRAARAFESIAPFETLDAPRA